MELSVETSRITLIHKISFFFEIFSSFKILLQFSKLFIINNLNVRARNNRRKEKGYQRRMEFYFLFPKRKWIDVLVYA